MTKFGVQGNISFILCFYKACLHMQSIDDLLGHVNEMIPSDHPCVTFTSRPFSSTERQQIPVLCSCIGMHMLYTWAEGKPFLGSFYELKTCE